MGGISQSNLAILILRTPVMKYETSYSLVTFGEQLSLIGLEESNAGSEMNSFFKVWTLSCSILLYMHSNNFVCMYMYCILYMYCIHHLQDLTMMWS